jgi:hypothetical protein
MCNAVLQCQTWNRSRSLTSKRILVNILLTEQITVFKLFSKHDMDGLSWDEYFMMNDDSYILSML